MIELKDDHDYELETERGISDEEFYSEMEFEIKEQKIGEEVKQLKELKLEV